MEPFDLQQWKNIPAVVDQIAIDTRRITSKNALFIALGGAHSDGHHYVKEALHKGAKFAVVHHSFSGEGIDEKRLIRVDSPLRALQEIAAIYRKEMKAKVIAVIGSCGKTMTKDLLSLLVERSFCTFASPESFNSQIGVALSLLSIKKEHEIAIIEAGVSRPGEMDYLSKMIQPDHVIVSNIGKSRIGLLDAHTIGSEILKLCSVVPEHHWCLLPSGYTKRTNDICWEECSRLPHIQRHGDRYDIAFPNGETHSGYLHEESSYLLDLLKTAVSGAYLLQAPERNICEALTTYIPEPMRIEVWKSSTGTTLINDTYAADPMSCDVALRQLESLENFSSKSAGKKIFLFGGLKGQHTSEASTATRLAHSIKAHRVDTLYTVDKSLIPFVQEIAPQTETIFCPTIEEAIEQVKPLLSPSDALLVKGAKKIPLKVLVNAFEESPPNNQVIVNLAVIQSNIEEIRAKVGPHVRLMVMVKALAYGTDDVRISKFLKNCGIDILGVSYVDEAVAMRQSGVTQSIFVLNVADHEIAKAVKWNLEVGVSSSHLIELLQNEAIRTNKLVKVHLHVNTGMNRFGCAPDNVLSISRKISQSPNLVFEGIMTHFACADDPSQDQFTLQQAHLLEQAILILEQENLCPPWRHACNSSATTRFTFPAFNMIRVGLAVYGLHASTSSKEALPLRPAISLVSRIVGMNECLQGDTVSYGRTYSVAKEKAQIAVLPIGYFDGLHRNYSNKGFVRIHGKKAPMCGKICMDYMMCDVSDIPEAKIGDQVLLFGEDDQGHYISPEELALLGSSIVHELMTCLGPRIRRFFIYDESLRPR